MHISQVRVEQDANHSRLAGRVGKFELWYDFPPSFNVSPRADAFVCAALLGAMQQGQDITLPPDLKVCPQLLQNLQQLQQVLLCRQHYLGLRLTAIRIRGGKPEPAPHNGKTVSFFSGGVDGTYTYLQEKARIDDVLFVQGIDIQLDNHRLYADAFARNQAFLQSQGHELLQASSNIRFLGHAFGLGWNSWNGAGLASIALAAGYQHCLIASGKSYAELYPDGSSYVSDHFCSSAGCQIEHHGAEASRVQKTALLALNPAALNILRVCWQDQSYNCGVCEKCLRTMLALKLLSVQGAPFPAWGEQQLQALKALRFFDAHNLANFEQLLELAIAQHNTEIVTALRHILNRYYWGQLAKQLDRLLFGERLLSLKRKWWRKAPDRDATAAGASRTVRPEQELIAKTKQHDQA